MKTATISRRMMRAVLLLILCPVATAVSAQTVAEIGDAGALPVSAQDETSSAISLITGSLSSVTDIDMYKITIDDPTQFSATTSGPTGGGVVNDTRLFLLDATGRPVYFNDDLPDGSTLRSLLPAGHALSPVTPNDYYLAVAGYPKYPTDGTTNIFSEPDFDPGFAYTDIIGANPATSNAITTWAGGNGPTGTYGITVTGVNGTLPVELSSLRVVCDDGSAIVTWTTQSESGSAEFDVELRPHGSDFFRTAGFVAAAGRPTAYAYRVENLDPGLYAFRLRQIDVDGSASYTSVVEAEVALSGSHFVSSAFPNPFTDETTINVVVSEPQRVRVRVYNLRGQHIATLADELFEASGTRRLSFDAEGLPSGVYLVQTLGERFTATSTVTLVR
jgi:hypothetical protein